jgi:hypothetical protein
MTSSELGDFWIHQVTVQTYQGITGSGVKSYVAGQTVDMFVEGKRRLVRALDGTQVISESTAYGDVGLAGLFVPQSLVTLPGVATPTTVIAVNVNDSAGLDLPDHVAVALQ